MNLDDLAVVTRRIERLEAQRPEAFRDDFEQQIVWETPAPPATPPEVSPSETLRARWAFTSGGAQTDLAGGDDNLDAAGVSTLALPLGAWSISMWVIDGYDYDATENAYLTGWVAGDAGMIVSYGPYGTYAFGPIWFSGAGYLGPVAGVPCHVAVTYNGGALRLLVDGVLEAAGTHVLTGSDIVVTGDAGYIADVRVYEACLSDAQVAALTAGGPNP